MAKRHMLVDACSSASKRAAITNWKLCILCQEDTGTALQCPYAAKGKPGIGYKTLADHLTRFNELGHMPINVDITQPHVQNRAQLILQRTNASSVMRKLDLKVSIMPAHMTLMRRSEAVHWKLKTLAKLVPGDMISLEAKYHRRCLTSLYNRARTSKNAATKKDSDDNLYGIAFAELTTFMEEFRKEEGAAPVLKLSDLADMYKNRLGKLGASTSSRVHSGPHF